MMIYRVIFSFVWRHDSAIPGLPMPPLLRRTRPDFLSGLRPQRCAAPRACARAGLRRFARRACRSGLGPVDRRHDSAIPGLPMPPLLRRTRPDFLSGLRPQCCAAPRACARAGLRRPRCARAALARALWNGVMTWLSLASPCRPSFGSRFGAGLFQDFGGGIPPLKRQNFNPPPAGKYRFPFG